MGVAGLNDGLASHMNGQSSKGDAVSLVDVSKRMTFLSADVHWGG